MEASSVIEREPHGHFWLQGLLLTWGSAVVALALLTFPRSASAEVIIKDDNGAPDYSVELEPHGVLTPFWPPGGSADIGVGAGLMVGINLAPRGFIPTINDSVALGLGLDWVNYFGGRAFASECAEWRGSGNQRICVRTRGGGGAGGTYFFSPVVMQWNFYFTDQWSAFGEPGFAVFADTAGIDAGWRFGVVPVFSLGGRWHFSKPATLTFRVGYPIATVGVSFYL